MFDLVEQTPVLGTSESAQWSYFWPGPCVGKRISVITLMVRGGIKMFASEPLAQRGNYSCDMG